MNKKFLMMAAVLTTLLMVGVAVVYASVTGLANPVTQAAGEHGARWTAKVYQALGIKTAEQMNQATAGAQTAIVNSESTATNSAVAPSVSSVTAPMVFEARATQAQAQAPAQQRAQTTVTNNTSNNAQSNGVNISAAQARNLAQRAAPSAQFGPAELVRYGGRVAYEVLSKQGNVYIDAQTGAVVGNTVVTQPTRNRYEDDDDEREHRSKKRKHREHEEEDDDDDDDEDRRG